MKLEDIINEYYQKQGDIGIQTMKKYKNNYTLEKNINDRTISIIVDNKPVLTFQYEFIASFDLQRDLWLWSNKNFSLDKDSIAYYDKILKFADELKKPTYKDHVYLEMIHSYLVNDVNHIKKCALFTLMKVCVYILKGIGTFSEPMKIGSVNKLNMYVIKNVTLNNI